MKWLDRISEIIYPARSLINELFREQTISTFIFHPLTNELFSIFFYAFQLAVLIEYKWNAVENREKGVVGCAVQQTFVKRCWTQKKIEWREKSAEYANIDYRLIRWNDLKRMILIWKSLSDTLHAESQ